MLNIFKRASNRQLYACIAMGCAAVAFTANEVKAETQIEVLASVYLSSIVIEMSYSCDLGMTQAGIEFYAIVVEQSYTEPTTQTADFDDLWNSEFARGRRDALSLASDGTCGLVATQFEYALGENIFLNN